MIKIVVLGLIVASVQAYPPYYTTQPVNTGHFTVTYPTYTTYTAVPKSGLVAQGRSSEVLEGENVDVVDTQESFPGSPLVLVSPQTLVSGLFIKPVFVTLPADAASIISSPSGLPAIMAKEPQRSNFEGLVPNIPEAVQPGAIAE